jgi:hypothetical protein
MVIKEVHRLTTQIHATVVSAQTTAPVPDQPGPGAASQ